MKKINHDPFDIHWWRHMKHRTIYEVLRDKLNREPTHLELCDEVLRILREAHAERSASPR